APRDAVARKDDRRLRALDELERAVDHRVLRLWIRGPADLERLHVGVLPRDVLGELDMRGARLLETREPEGLADDLGGRLGDADPRAPFRDRAEHAHDVDVLMRLLRRAFEGELTGDGEKRVAAGM